MEKTQPNYTPEQIEEITQKFNIHGVASAFCTLIEESLDESERVSEGDGYARDCTYNSVMMGVLGFIEDFFLVRPNENSIEDIRKELKDYKERYAKTQ